jgi:hypothetical protein
MPVAQGSCPGCGAPIEFGVGSSLAKVCEYCRATVVRTDRGLENLGKVAEIAQTPSLIAIGDQGTLGGRPFTVMGRVQLDTGKGPWDEYYVTFDYGQSWGWLAYAQGNWYVTVGLPGVAIPPYSALRLELDVMLGPTSYRVVEIRTGTIVSAEGEQPQASPPGFVRYYADCLGPQNNFATLDYGDNRGAYEVFVGYVFDEPQMVVTQQGPRTVAKVKTQNIKCPNCGGDVPKLNGERAQRLGCPFCGAVSNIATQQIVAQQEAAMTMPDVPIGSRGVLNQVEFVVIAYLRRSSNYEGERYTWEEYLLFSHHHGYRWLVKDPETGWSFITPANPAEIDLRGMPDQLAWGGRVFSLRNQNQARVDYVLGEVYWQCEVGETVSVRDYADGNEVLSREETDSEVYYSYGAPIAWPMIAQAFGLAVEGPGEAAPTPGGKKSGCGTVVVVVVVIVIVLLLCAIMSSDSCGSGGFVGGTSSGSGIRGSGTYSGGK